MQIKNSELTYGVVAKSIHWVVAIIMIGLLGFGLYMVRIPISLEKVKLYGWHKEFGMLVLMLAIVRIIWRLYNVVPKLSIPMWEQLAARTAHWGFYGLMFALPITGWLMSSAAGLPVSFFGWFVLPDLIAPDQALEKLLVEVHKWLSYGLIGLLCAHVGASLKHHFIDKNDILRRML